MALSLYKYFEARDSTRISYHELEFHMKALVDDVINRIFADVAAPPVEGEGKKAEPSAEKASGKDAAADPWADF